MRKNLKMGIIFICIIFGLLSNQLSLECKASDVENPGDSIMMTDKIVYKTRKYNGRNQYRRWNATKKKWVDPHWIDF